MDKIELLRSFKENFIIFLDELIEQFPEENNIMVFRIMLHDQLPVEDVIINLCRKILPYKELIINKDEKFFLNDENIFSDLDNEEVIHFKKLWNSDKLDNQDKDEIWNWFRFFIIQSEKYQSLSSHFHF